MTKAGASERALKAAEEVRSLAMNYFGYATATGDTNEVYQKFPVTGVAAIIDAFRNLGGYCVRCMEIEKAVTYALEAAVVRFEFVALEYCERWKVMPKQFIDKGTAAIRGKAVKSG